MKRANDEKHIAKHRAKLYARDSRQHSSSGNCNTVVTAPPENSFRKARRAGGCGICRCDLCHPYKFPKRQRTMREQLAECDLNEQCFDYCTRNADQ